MAKISRKQENGVASMIKLMAQTAAAGLMLLAGISGAK